MSVALYMDHHVPSAVTQGLRLRDVDVITSHQDGTADWDDDQILGRAHELGRTVYTQDADYLVLAARCLAAGTEHSGIVYAHQLSITVGQAIADLELIAKVMEPEELHNQVVFIPFG
jgi:hypothetical protein